MDDLGVITLDTRVAVDTGALTRLGVSSRTKQTCLAFAEQLDQQPHFSVDAQSSYCKIRIRTECACLGDGYDRGGSWIKVHLATGPSKGKDGWVCKSAVRPSVVWP